jgi:hypothetical protein
MRKLALPLLLAGSLASAAGVTITPAVRFEFTDCAAGGSASQSVTAGSYLLRVTDADVWLCWGATCASGGEKFPSGTVLLLNVTTSQQFSCRSTGSAADVIFTRGQ